MAALGSSVSFAFFNGEHLYTLTLSFALLTAVLIAYASKKQLHLEALIGLLYVLGASGVMVTLAQSAQGMEHFSSLLASDILFSSSDELWHSAIIYFFIALFILFIYPKISGFLKELLFFFTLAIAVTSSVSLVGVLVVFTLLIAPTLLAITQTRFKQLPFASVYAWIFSTVAIFLAYYFDLPTGYTIVFCASLLTTILVIFFSPTKPKEDKVSEILKEVMV